MKVWIKEDIISKYYKNKVLLISTGGVGSEYLTKLLNIYHPINKLPTGYSIKGAVVHFPHPPKNLKQVIYIYGDIYNAILSQIGRHYDNASKICNNLDYPHFHNLEQLFSINIKDPWNIEKQFLNFNIKKTNYPIILLKYGFDVSLIPILIKITGNNNFKNYKFKKRVNKFNLLNTIDKGRFQTLYNNLNIVVNTAPDLIIRFPNINYKLSNNDVIKYKKKNSFPGKIIRHYKNINGYEIYNERKCTYKPNTVNYGCLRIRKKGDTVFSLHDFEEYGISLKNFGGVEDPRYFVWNNKTFALINGFR